MVHEYRCEGLRLLICDIKREQIRSGMVEKRLRGHGILHASTGQEVGESSATTCTAQLRQARHQNAVWGC